MTKEIREITDTTLVVLLYSSWTNPDRALYQAYLQATNTEH